MVMVHEVRIPQSRKRRHAFLAFALFAALAACGSTDNSTGSSSAEEVRSAAASLSVQSLSISPGAPAAGQTVTATAVLQASASTTLQTVTVAVRDAAGNNLDFPDQSNVTVGTGGKTLTFSRSFASAGTYTYFVAYQQNNTWTNLSPQQSFTVGGSSGSGDAGTGGGTGKNPNGPGGTWTLKFDDEFDGTAYDTSKWADSSSAEGDQGHGNQSNGQLEWNQGKNCTVSGGVLTMTAKRESYTSSSGTQYDWTSCLLTTTPSYTFQYGYIEERAKLPAPRGFWPAFWTWQANGVNSWQETDVYEFYSDNHNLLYLTAHAGSGGGTKYQPPFDPSADFHTYGADIEPDGVTWYIDGVNVYKASGGAPSGATNIIANLAVFRDVPPDASTTTATKQVDYIRAWQH